MLIIFFLGLKLRRNFSILRSEYRGKFQKKTHFKGKEEMEFLKESISVPIPSGSRYSNKKMKESEVKKLLKLIEKDPVIYDRNLSDFSSSEIYEAKNEAWTRISSQMKRNCMFLLNLYS